jgi:hypothetical protein
MGQRYTVSRDNITPTGGQDVITIISAASRRVRLVSIDVTGRGTSSASQQVQIAMNPTGTTPGGAIVPSKAEHTEQPAAASTTATTWSVQPALATNYVALGWNALGGVNRWTTPPGRPQGMFEARNGDVISIRAPSGPTFQAMSFSVVVEED